MEDEGSYGNDDIRCFILSNLATAKMSKTFCVVCQSAMQIYDRYPLIDGTFFLSPKQYSKACIPVSIDLDKIKISHVECSAHLAKVIFDLKSAYNRFFSHPGDFGRASATPQRRLHGNNNNIILYLY